jgi:hypothetical protein
MVCILSEIIQHVLTKQYYNVYSVFFSSYIYGFNQDTQCVYVHLYLFIDLSNDNII